MKRMLTAVLTIVAVLGLAVFSNAATYTVKKGDCLSKIAQNLGIKWSALYEANKDKISNSNLIFPGQVFKIPEKGKPVDIVVAKTAVAFEAEAPFLWNNPGINPFSSRDFTKAINMFNLPQEVKTMLIAEVKKNTEPKWHQIELGDQFEQMVFDNYKVKNNVIANWKPEVHDKLAARIYSVEHEGIMYFLVDPLVCRNWAWWSEESTPSTGCIQVKKIAYDKDGNQIDLTPEFGFSLDGGEITVRNDQTGRAKFEKVMPGPHKVNETLTHNWKQESVVPRDGIVDVSPGDVCSEVTFVNRQTPVEKPRVEEEELLLEEEELLLPLIFPTIEVAAEVPKVEFKIKPLIRKPCLVCKPDWEAWVYTGYHWGAQDHNRYDWDWYYGGNISLFACEIQIAGGIFRAGPSLQWVGWQGEVQRKIGYQGEMGLYGAELQYLKGNMKDQLKVYFGTKRGEVWGKGFDYSSSEKNRMWAFEGAHQQWRNKKWFPEWEVGFRLEIGQSSGWKNSSVNNVEIYDPAKDQNLYMGRFKTEIYRAKYFRPTFEISGGYRGFDDALLAEFRPGIRETYYNVAEVDVSYSWIEYSQNNMWGVHLLLNVSNAGGHIYRHIKRSIKASGDEKKAGGDAPNGKFLDYRLNTIGP